MNEGSTTKHSLRVAEELCDRTSGGEKDLYREAETNDCGRKRWRRQWEKREAWKMKKALETEEEQPPIGTYVWLEEEGNHERVDRARRSMAEGRTAPKA